ncbi:hypothetical protein [Sphingomonas palmae]|uniref:hypothetical protein n=1 Tax=Sphingomonas palmae TaxID=1855283 RepID=UPI000B1ADB1F|nr:hypothetical protein [Sphingomonas palmae]
MPFGSERERVEHLVTLYQRLVDPLVRDGARPNRRVARRRARDEAAPPSSDPDPA